MDTNTVASLFALIKEKGKWTSSNICLPVFETLESDEVIEVDLCSTQCRLGEEGTSRMSTRVRDGVPVFSFRVSFLHSDFPNT
jgi:hypothetical protein